MKDKYRNAEFAQRRLNARVQVNQLDLENQNNNKDRSSFFEQVYQNAKCDGAQIPWADLQPKTHLVEWLQKNPATKDEIALDIACGLGDNAEAMAQYGYRTSAFDVSKEAIEWAKMRFPSSKVGYHSASLFNPPKTWLNKFDLVHECYTLQALPPEQFHKTAEAIAGFVKPGGRLLVYTRVRPTGREHSGPPWPLTDEQIFIFQSLGLEVYNDTRFEIHRTDKTIPHSFSEWIRSA